MSNQTQKRLEVRLKTPNPLISQWLKTWLDEAIKGSTTERTLQQALNSIQQYPLPIYCGQDCAILKGFSKRLCDHIDKKLLLQQQAPNKNNAAEKYENQLNKVLKKVNKKQAKQNVAESNKPITLHPGEFKIWLLVDTAETTGKNKCQLDNTRALLQQFNVQYEVRRLTIGDFLWVARDAAGNELVLPYIVERKRLDDLASSIRDGRFHEQKHRLQNCGLAHVIYLIENYIGQLSLPLENVQQAIINTQIHTNFQTVRTADHNETMLYLSNYTAALIENFEQKTLCSTIEKTELCASSTIELFDADAFNLLEFKQFYKDSARNANITVGEIFIKQLLQIHSLTLDKAVAITKIYATPMLLYNAYLDCKSEQQARQLLCDIRYGKNDRRIGAKISEILYDFYMTEFQ